MGKRGGSSHHCRDRGVRLRPQRRPDYDSLCIITARSAGSASQDWDHVTFYEGGGSIEWPRLVSQHELCGREIHSY